MLKVTGELLVYVKPMLMKELLSFIEDSSCYPERYPYFISSLLLVFTVCQSTIANQYSNTVGRLGMHTRTAAMGLLSRKSLRIASVHQPHHTQKPKVTRGQAEAKKAGAAASEMGKVATLISKDCDKLKTLTESHCNCVWQPLSMIVSMCFLYSVIGVSSLVGLGCSLVLVPIQVCVGKRLALVRKHGRESSDQRVGLVHELVVGIRIIKFLAWEMPFLKQVGDIIWFHCLRC